MNISDVNRKKILLLGYGIEGKATHEFLIKQVKAKTIGIADKKLDGENYLQKQREYDIAIKSPGIHKSEVFIPYTTATNIFFANTKGFTIGITGTKGKSTTTALIYHILKTAGKRVVLAGNITHTKRAIGQPLLSAYDQHYDYDAQTTYVCELSSYQLDDMQYAPDIAVFTSFFPEHMDFHGSEEAYWNAKRKIVAFSKANNFFVYNPRFPLLAKLAKEIKAKAVPYREMLPFPEKIVPLIGKHNLDNVKAAITVAKIVGINDEDIKKAVASFTPLPHRLEYVDTVDGITFYDDAISTTPQSTIQAIESLKNINTLMLGGQDRGYNFAHLAQVIMLYNIPNLVLFPESGEKIEKELRIKKKITILKTTSMEEAVRFAYKHSKPGTIVLLSPASPSYSLWKNFEERGNLFKDEVMKLT